MASQLLQHPDITRIVAGIAQWLGEVFESLFLVNAHCKVKFGNARIISICGSESLKQDCMLIFSFLVIGFERMEALTTHLSCSELQR